MKYNNNNLKLPFALFFEKRKANTPIPIQNKLNKYPHTNSGIGNLMAVSICVTMIKGK